MVRRLPSLNALRAFEAAGRHGRMIHAADELCVSHSAISRQVQALEQSLGVPLFTGPKNRLRLTAAGASLLATLSVAFDQIDGAVRAISDPEDGPLDVSCPGTFTMRWLIPRLYRFQAEHPGIEVRLTASARPVDFSRDGCDVAIRVGDPPWPDGADVIALFPEQLGLLCRPGADRDSLPRLRTLSRPSTWADWGAAAPQAPQPSGAAVDYEHFYFMLEAASAGLGACVAPWPYVTDEIAQGRLAAPHGFVNSGHAYVALRRQGRNRRADHFCAWLRQEAAAFQQQRPAPLA